MLMHICRRRGVYHCHFCCSRMCIRTRLYAKSTYHYLPPPVLLSCALFHSCPPAEGAVYAVEFSHRSGRDLVNMAKQRPNIIPIIEDARHPQKYRMLVPMVDVIFADVAQPDQARIVGLNAQYFLKNGGNFVISIKASCIDSTAPPEAVFAREVGTLFVMSYVISRPSRCKFETPATHTF